MKKAAIAVLLSVCMIGSAVTPAISTRATEKNEDPISAAPDGSEDWASLTLDLGGAESNDEGYNGTPLGNGLFGVKENGGVSEDVFQLNHMTFWSGDPKYRDDTWNGQKGYKNSVETKKNAYQKLRETLKEAYSEGISSSRRAELMKSIEGTTQSIWNGGYQEQANYLSQGQLRMNFPQLGSGVSDYKRILNMDEATSDISFRQDGVSYQRETFISNPDNIMVTRLTNDSEKDMEMILSLTMQDEMVGMSQDNVVWADADNAEVVMTGRAPCEGSEGNFQWDENRGILFESRAKILLPEGGKIVKDGNSLKVQNAKEIVVLYTSETSFKDSYTDPSNSGVDYSKKVRTTLDQAEKYDYAALKTRHLKEYQELFRRMWIELDGKAIKMSNGSYITPQQFAKHYQYGRYISICCERKNSVVSHGLTGLWLPTFAGANNGSWFMNENVEKMAAVNGAGNLSDASDGLYNLVSIWANEATGQKTAQQIYGAEGEDAWVVSHSSDIWGQTAMYGESIEYGSWLAGGMWVLDLLYDKYDYTQDINLLKKYYPLMEGAAEFALSTLMQVDGVNGELKDYLVIAPSGSPEHWYTVDGQKAAFDIGSACDIQIYTNLFNILEKGAKALKKNGIEYDEDLLKKVSEAKAKMVPLEMFIDKSTGRLREWYNEYPVGDLAHRHASHLLGLFLNHLDINPVDQSEVYAAEQAESIRWRNANGGEHPDRATMTLRAGDPEYAFSHFTHGIVASDFQSDTVMQWTPVVEGIAEAILDSRFDSLNILAEMPSEWTSGTVKGLCGRGGYELGISWKDGELTQCAINSTTGTTPKVLYKGYGVDLSKDARFTLTKKTTTLEEKKEEAAEKLEGSYTNASKAALRKALKNGSADEIDKALLAMKPLYLETFPKTTTVDDRDTAIQYTGSWSTWEEDKHSGGTITYSSAAGDTAEYTFEGTGIEVISSIAGHLGAVRIEIDGELQKTVVVNADSLGTDSAYNVSIYKNENLSSGKHTIRLIAAENNGKARFDMDALVVYQKWVDESEPETDQTESETKPTESETKPTESETRPTESETKPTESETKPSETKPGTNVKPTENKKPANTKQVKVKASRKYIKVTWRKVTGAKKYDLYRSTSKKKGYRKIAALKGSRTSYKDKRAKRGKKYYYKVVTVGKSGRSSGKRSNAVKLKK